LRIVITGSSGRVGRAIFNRLAPGHDVVGIDRSPSSATRHLADIAEEGVLERLAEGADAIIHAAALHAPHVGLVPDAEFVRVNVVGTARSIAAAKACGIGRIVFTSTTALYGDAIDPEGCAWIDETTVPRPRTVYHRTKLEAEQMLEQAASRPGGPSVAIIRMSRCFPEPADIMAAYRLHRGIDARDVAAAHDRALQAPPGRLARFVASGWPPFARDDCAMLAKDAGEVLRARCPELVDSFARRGWPLPRRIDRIYSPHLAVDRLGWRPRFGFAEVIAQHDRGSLEVLPPIRRQELGR
jgi:UDP-glucose 4-epimerase